MILLNSWILFSLIPLFLLYTKAQNRQNSLQTKLLYISIFLGILALSRPVLDNRINEEKVNASEYIIALDASYSMQATDLSPSRYIFAKRAVEKLLKTHPKDRFTLFVFTSNALLISPPTTDSLISMQALNALNPKYILTKSTSLKHLFQTVAKTSFEKKDLIIFSDGGEEKNLQELLQILKKNKITPYIVATATTKGATLLKNGALLKKSNATLVISKINPILKDLAYFSDGKYYELSSTTDVQKILQDINTHKKETFVVDIKSYTELFYYPLFIALIFYFLAITKLHQLFVFLPLLLITPKVDANLLDFHYLQQATQEYNTKKYLQSAKSFKAMSPSVRVYYNIATSYYKAKAYNNALEYFSQIQTSNKKLKQKIYYNMGNCSLKLKKYKEAEKFYSYALAFGADKDARYNLNLIHKYHLKAIKDAQKMLPDTKQSNDNTSKKKNTLKVKNKKQKTNKKAKGSSSKQSQESSAQSSQSKQKFQNHSPKKERKKKKSNYQMGYKAYEIINKGYADEKEPW